MRNQIAAVGANVPQLARKVLKKMARNMLRWRMRAMGAEDDQRIRSERLLRGRAQYRLLRQSNNVVVSCAKSGRTWLRLMLSRTYQQVYHLPEEVLIEFDNFHYMNRAIPRIFFTHDDYMADYTGNRESKADYAGHKVLLLVRDPRDVAVSKFFQWKHRSKPGKKALKQYSVDPDIGLYDFIMGEQAVLAEVINFMNEWARAMGVLDELLMIRYEDLKADPAEVLSKVVDFLKIPADPGVIEEAVAYASYDNMKRMETEQSFRLSGGRLAPGDPDNPDSYKVRRGKVGGYQDYLDDHEIRAVDALVTERLDPVFGYTGEFG